MIFLPYPLPNNNNWTKIFTIHVVSTNVKRFTSVVLNYFYCGVFSKLSPKFFDEALVYFEFLKTKESQNLSFMT